MQKKDEEQSKGIIASLIGAQTPSKRAGVLYSLVALAFLGVSFLVALIPKGNDTLTLYFGYLAAPVAFSLVVAWYFSFTKTKVTVFLKEQVCSPKYYLVALLVQIGLFSLGQVNGLFLQFLEGFGYAPTVPQIPSTEGFGLVGTLLVVAVLPSLMEEFFFRGVFQREMKGFSLVGQVLICGGLFSLFHQNPVQTVYQFICGAAFALVAARSGSFFPTVLSHFINNAAIILLYAFGWGDYALPIPAVIVGNLCLVASVLYLVFWDKKERGEKTGSYKQLFVCAAFGIFIVGFNWLATLFTGF